MEKIQKKVEELHALVTAELGDPELHGVLRACLLTLKKECEALDSALHQLVVEGISQATSKLNELIQAEWADPEVQVDPNAPRPVAVEAAPADENALD